MQKRPPTPSGITQKTTSRIALIGIAAAAMMITLSIIAIQQEASAAKPRFCFNFGSGTSVRCFDNQLVCRQIQHLVPGSEPCRAEPGLR
jgi:hypothetical protein